MASPDSFVHLWYIFMEYLDYLLFLSLQIEPYIQKGNEGFVHHFLVYECRGDYNESHYGFGVDFQDIANMPFRKCFYGKVLAVWGVGGEIKDCKLALLQYCGTPVFHFPAENHHDIPVLISSPTGKR